MSRDLLPAEGATVPRRTPLWTRAAVSAEDAARAVRVDGAFHAAMLQWTSGAFLAAFALAIGAGPTLIGLVAALPLVMRLSQLYASWRIERAGHWRRSAFVGAVLARGAPLLLLPVALAPAGAIPPELAQALLLAVLAVGGVGTALFDVAWLTWMAELVPPAVRGRFFAGRARVTALTGSVAALGAALVMDRWRAARGAAHAAAPAADGRAVAFGVLFAVAAAVGLAGLWWLRRVPDPRRHVSRADGPSLGEALRVPLADRAFRPMLAFGAAWGLAMGFAAPFFAVYMLTALRVPLLGVTATVALMTFVTSVVQRHYGRLADRFGTRTVLRAGTLLFVTTPLPWLLASPTSWWALWAPLVVLHVVSGVATAATDLTLNPLVLKLAPDGRRASYLASFGAVYAAAQAVAPLLGGALLGALSAAGLEPRAAFGAVFLTAALLRALAVPILGRVHEPEAASVERMVRVVGRARTMRAARARGGAAGRPSGGGARAAGAVARAVPLEPALSAVYTHVARVAELAERVGARIPEPERGVRGVR